jgi:uroporphyrinogen decarboxylase
LLGSQELITEKVEKMIERFGTTNYTVNLGHGLWPEHNPENVGHFVKEV